MQSNEYIINLRLALADGRISDCHKMLYELLKCSQHEELAQKISFLEWHKEHAERERDYTSYKIELNKTISQLKKVGFNQSDIQDFTPAKFDKEDFLKIEGNLVNISHLFNDFLGEWKGKIVSVVQGGGLLQIDDFIVLKEYSVEIYAEINLLENEIYFRCWGEMGEIDSFLDSIKDWWLREAKERGALKVFLSYSHQDEKWKDAIITSLGILKQNNLIKIWHDRGIKAGDNWSEEIEKAMNESQLVFLLISPEFISSDYCYKIETPKALKRHDQKLARVIPIFVRHALDIGANYLHLQGFPQDKKPLKDFGRANTDNKGIQYVAKEILEIVYQIHKTGNVV